MPYAHEEYHRLPASVTINTLPDNVFREIFAFRLSKCSYPDAHMKTWQRLVHVCQRWRQIIYGSPHYLDLHLHCESPSRNHHTPFRKILSCWPEFPLTVDAIIAPDESVDDLIAVLKHPDRVHHATLSIRHSDSGVWEVLEMMNVSFPVLTHLNITGPDPEDDDEEFDLPDDFLGGSAPFLQHLHLDSISFGALPKLLLSACGLVSLQLEHIPAAGWGHISPKAMIGGLSGLTKLRALYIVLDLPDPGYRLPQRKFHDLPKHAVLPSLTEFVFRGKSKYLEKLVAQIDMPQVENVEIEYFTSNVQVEIRKLSQSIAHLEFAQFWHAQVTFDFESASITLDCPQGKCHQVRFSLTVTTSDPEFDFQVKCMAGVLGQLGTLLSSVDSLSVKGEKWLDGQPDGIDHTEWLPLLHLFPAVKALHVSGGLAVHFASALEDMDEERVTRVLPALHSLWIADGDKPVGSTERFLSLRQISGLPVTVVNTQDEFVG